MTRRSLPTLLVLLAALLAALGATTVAAIAAPLGPAAVRQNDAQEGGDKKGDKKEDAKARKKRLDAEARKAATALREKLAKGDVAERRAALTDASETDHPDVIAAMAKALRDEDVGVRRVALELFGQMQRPEAMKACMAHARSARKALAKDPETMVILLRAVGRKEDPKAIDWLVKGAFEVYGGSLRRARLFGAARTRSVDALDAILTAMSRTDANRLRGGMREARIALIWITGKDLGQTAEAWTSWWRDNKASFKVPERAPKLEESMEREWRSFWGEERLYERQKKRGDRG